LQGLREIGQLKVVGMTGFGQPLRAQPGDRR
jgi:hypothetical protein